MKYTVNFHVPFSFACLVPYFFSAHFNLPFSLFPFLSLYPFSLSLHTFALFPHLPSFLSPAPLPGLCMYMYSMYIGPVSIRR